MDLTTYLIFVPIALLSICSPGPATMLAISNSLNYGFARVNYSTLGNVVGQFIVAGLAMLGVGAVLNRSEALFEWLKVAGALYLIYLGIKQWRSKGVQFAASKSEDARANNRSIGLKGLFLALSNPKDIFFFTALLPQFIHADAPVLPQFLTLVISFMVFSYASLMAWAFAAHTAKDWLGQQTRMQWFNRLVGSAFVALGVGILRIKRAT